VAQRLRQVALQHRDLGLFLRDEVVAAGLPVLRERVPGLLDHPFENALDAGVIELLAGIDLALLDRGKSETQSAEPRLVAGAQGGLHILFQTALQRHRTETGSCSRESVQASPP